MFLNVVTAARAVPYITGGRRVTVVIDRCGGAPRVCGGTYRLGGTERRVTEVDGADSSRPGDRVQATVRPGRPGTALAADPRVLLAEAGILTVAGAALAVVAARGAVRARRRRRARVRPAAVPTPPAEPAEPDPLAWARRRKFGAGG